MKKAVGSIPMYTLIAVFLVIVFAFLAAMFSYYKAFKLNGKVTSLMERCEGKSSCYDKELKRLINNYSYTVKGTVTCPEKSGVAGEIISQGICLYRFNNEGSNKRYSFGVVTFLTWDFPIINQIIKMPIYSKTDRLYKF